MPLDKDNAGHRSFSTNLDNKCGGQGWYDKAARPVMHGVYHTGRYLNSGNSEEIARAADQFGKFGTGQSQSDYLAEVRASEAARKAAEVEAAARKVAEAAEAAAKKAAEEAAKKK